MDLPEQAALQVLADIGWLPGLDAKACLGEADPDPEHEPDRPKGIPVFRNPFAQLRDDPELWAVWDEWRLGYRSKPSSREYTSLSAWHLDALRELRCAQARHHRRLIKRDTEGDDERRHGQVQARHKRG